MKEKELLEGLKNLDDLSRGDYREPLAGLVAKTPDPDMQAVGRISRLIGVSLKLPFAQPLQLNSPSFHSHSYRAWELVPAAFETPGVSKTWQYRTLEYLSDSDGYSNVVNSGDGCIPRARFFSLPRSVCSEVHLRGS